MRTRLSIATGTQPSSSSAAPTPRTKVPTSRASRRATVSSQQLAGGDENEDPSGTIRGKKRAAPSSTRDVETTVSKKKARGGGANIVETGRKKVKKGARVVDSDEQESDDEEQERIPLEADEVEEEEEEIQATATKKKGKGKGRAATTTTTKTTGGRKPRASSTSRARLSTSRTAGGTTSKKPIRSTSTLTNAAQSSSHSHSHTASSTSTSTVLAAAPTSAKPNGDRAHVSTKSSVAVLVPGTSSSEMDRREALEMGKNELEAELRDADADAEMAMMDDEDDDEGGLLIIVPGSDEEEEEMGGDEEDGDDDRVEVERVGSEEVDGAGAAGGEEEEEANDAMEDTDEEEEGQEGEEGAKSRVLLDAEHEELPADDTEGMEKQFGNSEDSFEARPYPRRNLLPNFLSQAANAKNPFLANDNNPTDANSSHSPKGKAKAARPSHPLSQALSPTSGSHSSNHDQPASPPFGTKQLLLSREDRCVCGEAFGLLREEMEEEGGVKLRWHEHVGLCEVLEGYKRKGWRVFREL